MLLYDYVIKFIVIMYAQLLLSYNLDSNTGQTEIKFLNWSWASIIYTQFSTYYIKA